MNQKMVVHCQRAHYDVLIDRTTKWGNPYTTISDRRTRAQFVVKTRTDAIAKYESYIRQHPTLVAQLHELDGKVLGCWCDPFECHGTVLVKLVAELCVDCRLAFREADKGHGVRCATCRMHATIPDHEDG